MQKNIGKRAEGMDKTGKKEYTLIIIKKRCTVVSGLYRKMQMFLGDEQKLIERMAGRLDLWEECVALFPGKEILWEADEALQAEDRKAFYGLIHRLKGNLANFGFDAAAEQAMAVLTAVREENTEEIRNRYLQFRAAYGQIAERLGDAE